MSTAVIPEPGTKEAVAFLNEYVGRFFYTNRPMCIASDVSIAFEAAERFHLFYTPPHITLAVIPGRGKTSSAVIIRDQFRSDILATGATVAEAICWAIYHLGEEGCSKFCEPSQAWWWGSRDAQV